MIPAQAPSSGTAQAPKQQPRRVGYRFDSSPTFTYTFVPPLVFYRPQSNLHSCSRANCRLASLKLGHDHPILNTIKGLEQSVIMLISIHSDSIRLTYLTMVYAISAYANCCPIQILGPPLNGINVHGLGDQFLHLSGLNSSASGPKISFLRCITKAEYAIGVPAGTPTG